MLLKYSLFVIQDLFISVPAITMLQATQNSARLVKAKCILTGIFVFILTKSYFTKGSDQKGSSAQKKKKANQKIQNKQTPPPCLKVRDFLLAASPGTHLQLEEPL